MNDQNPTQTVCFIGNNSHFSTSAFKLLQQYGVTVNKVICSTVVPIPGPQFGLKPKSSSETKLPVSPPNNETLETLAHLHKIPIQYIVNQAELDLFNIQDHEKPDFVLVACFPYRLPLSIINWPKSGSLNIHPSLLPRYRGPDPIFWQLRNGETNTGISLHKIIHKFDSGPIIKSERCSFVSGSLREEIETRLATKGASLFVDYLKTKVNLNTLNEAQDNANASYDSVPVSKDFEISSSWSALQAYNFIKGTCSPNNYYNVKTNNRIQKIITAQLYPDGGSETEDQPLAKDELLIQFSPGILKAQLFTN